MPGGAAAGLSVPEAAQQAPVAGLLLEALNLRPPTVGAGGVLTDPPALAQKLLYWRREAARALVADLQEDTDRRIAEVRRKSLERSMQQ